MVIRSKEFDDIYFSTEDGLAESQYIFLKGNNLPERWNNKERFTVFESGFGTGLNFLACWELFEQSADKNTHLTYISVEKFPLSMDEIHEMLSPWADGLGDKTDQLLSHYPLRTTGFHRFDITPSVKLILIFDDINRVLPELDCPQGIDCWFLDGFAPAKNPDMWGEALYQNMERLARPDTTFSTFTAAGRVKRGLEAAGFEVLKRKGYGKKRDSLYGHFVKDKEFKQFANKDIPQKIAIIGGGLAGTAASYVLSQKGCKTTIFEAGDALASGASGNDIGLFNPRFSAERSADADFFMAAWAQAVKTVLMLTEADQDIGYEPCGSLHLLTNDTRRKRLESTFESWGWHQDHMQKLSPKDASDIAGIDIENEALYLPDAGCVSPVRLCKAYAAGADVRLSQSVKNIVKRDSKWLVNDEPFDAVILACGIGAKDYDGMDWLPLELVRGQVSYLKPSEKSSRQRINICFGGYVSPVINGHHVTGATFVHGTENTDVIDKEHDDNRERLSEITDDLADLKISRGWAGLRTASKDRMPLIGSVPDRKAWKQGNEVDISGLYLSTGHGSHGIISSLMAAHLLSEVIMDQPRSLSLYTQERIAPRRFLERDKRRGLL